MAAEKGDGRRERSNSRNSGLHQGEHRIISSFFSRLFYFLHPFFRYCRRSQKGGNPVTSVMVPASSKKEKPCPGIRQGRASGHRWPVGSGREVPVSAGSGCCYLTPFPPRG